MYLSRFLRGAIAGAVLLTACDDDEPITFIDLTQGMYLGGAQTTRIEVTPGLGVVRAELYLDDVRIAADELAPFVLPWNTTDFKEGPRNLRARVYLDNSRTLDATLRVQIDNTAPTIEVPATADASVGLTVTAKDNVQMASVTIQRGDRFFTLDKAPYWIGWDAPCGSHELSVTAVDHLGWATTKTFTVTTLKPGDADCDGFAAAQDCNDNDGQIHPGAKDSDPAVDANCDGTAGNDADGDGVPPSHFGGTDCNDSVPEIHGAYVRWGRHELKTIDGQEITWSASDTVAIDLPPNGSNLDIATNRGGLIELWEYFDGHTARTPIAADANAGLALDRGQLVFARGNTLALALQTSVGWSQRNLATFDSRIGRIAVNAQSDLRIALQAGSELYYHEPDDGEPKKLATGLGQLAELHVVHSPVRGDVVLYRLANADGAFRAVVTDPPVVQRIDDLNSVRAIALTHSHDYYAVQYVEPLRAVVYLDRGDQDQEVASCDGLLSRLAAEPFGPVFLQCDGGTLVQYQLDASGLLTGKTDVFNAESIEHIEASGFESRPILVSSGVVYAVDREIEAAADPFGDGIDQDCDGNR